MSSREVERKRVGHASGSGPASRTRGFYVNEMAREVTAGNENYRNDYQRLVAIEAQYAPINLFRRNANVQPSALPG